MDPLFQAMIRIGETYVTVYTDGFALIFKHGIEPKKVRIDKLEGMILKFYKEYKYDGLKRHG